MNAKQIFLLLKEYDVDTIENSIIYLFIEKVNKSNLKNYLLKNRLKKINSECTNFVSNFLKDNKIDLNLKDIEKIFELLLESNDRSLSGAFYTPEFIAEYINKKVIDKKPDFKVCDCSCGSGAFLVLATEKIAKENNKSIIKTIEENIYGVDIMPRSIERTKIILSLLALQNNEDKEDIRFNLKCGDSLDKNKFDWNKEFREIFDSGGFDGVIGNPPYIRIQDFNKNLKQFLMKEYKTTNKGNFNLYFAFFELGLNILNKNGKMGYITPNNYFTSLSGKELREFFQKNRFITRIINFNHLRVFEDATTYTTITLLDKKEKEEFEYVTIEDQKQFLNLEGLKFSSINFLELNNQKWRLMNEDDRHNIKKIESTGIPLGDFAKIRVGIATLKDNLYFIDGEERDNLYVKRVNDKEYFIEKGITRKIIKIASVGNDGDIKKDKRRIIFPYEKSGNRFIPISEDKIKNIFPNTYTYLKEVRKELETRDKGKNKPKVWFAYGREQGLNLMGKKLLTKTFSNKPNFMLDEDESSMFCNGYAIFPKEEDINLLRKILNSKLMDYYIKKTSVEIEGDYQCYQKNFIEKFSIPFLTKEERTLIINGDNSKVFNFLMEKFELRPVPFLVI